MLKSEYLNSNRIVVITILFASVFTVFSCRKKILHQSGIKEIIYANSSESSWVKVTSNEITDIRALQVYNNLLYFGGDFTNNSGIIKCLGKLDTNDMYYAGAFGSFVSFDGVFDLAAYNGKLLIAGNYYYGNTSTFVSGRNLFTLTTSANMANIPFADNSAYKINGVTTYNGGLIVYGDFAPGSGSSCVTENIDFMSGTNPSGLGGWNNEIYSAAVFNSEVYAAAKTDLLLKFNGTIWSTLNYLSKSSSDKVYDLCVFNNTLYMFGDFQGGIVIKKMSSSGSWTNETSISSLGTLGQFGGFKVIGTELYVCGNSLTINGSLSSSVLKLDTEWQNVGKLNAEVRDLVKFNNKLYAATNYGLYKF